ncbi:MAG: type II toxin-antitoxin system VapC family toxin [Chitinispirillaceae bacterium]|nr:type II toxin-antitoxin system VapC family toxin [Chitinispirillaceae bacterium]
MNKKLLVDTDVTIDFLRGEKKAVSHFKQKADVIRFSSITVAEIYSGIKSRKEEAEIERLFTVFPVIDVTGAIGKLAGMLVQQYRPSHSVEIPDAIIAATCIISDFELHTLNVKHYPMFAGLQPPYKKA